MTRRGIPSLLTVAIALTVPGQALGQADTTSVADTLPAARYRLDAITAVAYGRSTVIRESAAATSVLIRKEIEGLPARTLSDVLAFVPGLIFLERDGSGQLPMAVARGFFGGGETSYLRLMIDGVPLNEIRTGTVEWPLVPLSSVERVEVLRGGASTMYGDAAMGAVVNVSTRSGAQASPVRGSTGFGAWGERHVQAAGSTTLGAGLLSVNGAWSELDGFREHSASEDLSFAAAYRSSEPARLRFSARASGRRQVRDEPGPLRADDAALEPRQRNPLFASDHRTLDMLDLSVGLERQVSASRTWKWDGSLRVTDDQDRQTLLLTSDFGDTQVRQEDNWNLWTRFQYDAAVGRTSVTAGTEIEYGEFSTDYLAPDDGADLLASGIGGRLKLGVYAEGRQRLTQRWNLFAGIRLDVLDVDRDDPAGTGADYAELSPRVGVNFAYSLQEDRPGHAYASLTSSFKVPTLDQLYDVREFPTGAGTIGISNPDLQPQTSTAIEVGIFQRFPLWANAFAELDVAMYRLTVDDEIDFDLSTFRFGNILESRHDGLELSVTARLSRWIALQHSSTFMRVVFRSGALQGNGLKNIPRRALATALNLSLSQAIQLSLTHRHTGSLYLDDGNSHEIQGYHRFGMRADWDLGPAAILLSADNLFDRRASSLGFLSFDPASGEQIPFVYPIGGRALRAGLSIAG